MKRQVKVTGAILLLLAVLARGTALASPDIIRLHVIAHSNAPADQRIKEAVRDRIIGELGPVVAQMSAEEVMRWLPKNTGRIADLAGQVLAEAGVDHPVRVKYGVTVFPTRSYGSAICAAGKYRTVRVELGAGQGRNWWCIIFPPLCFVRGTAGVDGESPESSAVEVRFWLWEKLRAWLTNIF
ncbi:MAG: stage II sporulation protein R [Firmicutes bacterium]|jgi:stage II sporulation protein R|nr:stage II sporulation protein R [Bacillota bacterium]HOB34890.1 stage II sporulation protein R [Bacillota bacterium]HPZ91142.1 stage II sporulation protein R [Bacillota bacterium]HQE02001.1 stage II sporulation protein R [Bacillota bacterium]